MDKVLNTSPSLASCLGLNTPLTVLPAISVKQRPLWHRVVASIVLTSSLLVQTGQVLAQYQYGQGAYSPSGDYNNAPKTGYAPNGQLYLGGQPYKEPQAHIDARNVANSILYNVVVKGLSEPTAANPGFVHDSLSQIDSGAAAANASASAGGGRSATVVYFGKTNNIYGVNGSLTAAPTTTPATPNALANYNTYKDILTNAPGAGYQTIVAPPNAPGTAAVPYVNGPYLAKTAAGSDSGLATALFYNAPNSTAFDLAQSTQTPTGSSLIGGGVAVNLNQNATQVNHLANLSGGLTFANTAWLSGVDPNQANQLSFGSEFGYFGRQGQYVALSSTGVGNLMSGGAEGGNDTGMIDRQALIKQLQQQAQKLDKREGYQIAANSLNLNGFSPTDLFREGYDLYKYNPSLQANGAAQNDLLRRLQSGQLSAGSADYMEAVRIAQERYRIAYSVRLEYKTPLKFSVEDAQRKANQLNLEGINPNELFGQGFDLFVYNPAIQPNGAAENALLARLQSGQLTPGSSEYNQAAAIAQERLRIAYSQSLVPPEPKSIPKWKLIVGVVVGAVLTFVTAGAAAPFIASALTGVSVAAAGAALTAGFFAGTMLGTVITAVSGIVAGAVGAMVSTTITTGSLSQGIKAGGNALVSGSVKAIVAAAIGFGFDFAGLSGLEGVSGTVSNMALNTLSGAVSSTILGGGSFADNLGRAAVSSVVDGVSKEVANGIGNAFPNLDGTNVVNYAAHGVLGCAGAVAKGGDCAAGAVGAVTGEAAAATGFMDAAAQGTIGRTLTSEERVFFGGVIGGAAGAATGNADSVQSNFGIGQSAGANAVENNANAIKVVKDLLIKAAQVGIGGLEAAEQATIRLCANSSGCMAIATSVLPVGALTLLGSQRAVTTPSSADQIPTGYPNAPPPAGGAPPSLIAIDNQPNNTGNDNPVTNTGLNNTGGNQISQPNGSNAGTGYGAGGAPNVGNGVVMSTVPPSILGSNGQLPPVTGVNGGAIERPATANPNQTAEQFARDAFNGQTPVSTKPIDGKSGAWVAELPDGTHVTYRPAGQASSSTLDTTATVEVNSPSVKAINKNAPAKFKFPQL